MMITIILIIPDIAFSAENPASQGIKPSVPFPLVNDFIHPDSLQADSLNAEQTREKGVLDTTITYSAQSVKFTFQPRLTTFDGNAKVRYRQVALDAEHIEVYWDDDILTAKGRLDTVKVETEGAQKDSIYWKGLPRLKDGTQVIDGFDMVYNIETRKGKVSQGATVYQDGSYHGNQIKMIERGEYNIRSGFYTTCDAEESHYGFWSRDMKLVVKDKVVARPVVLYFGPVPVAIIPFGVFPSKGGRHSGIIVPSYGESASQGRYFNNLGYYLAPNDYYDLRGSLDFYEKYGIRFRAYGRYALRYHFNGSLSGSYVNEARNDQHQKRWDISIDHSHILNPTTSLVVHGYFVSDGSYLQDLSQNEDERLKQQIESNATLSKRWEDTPYSGTLNLKYREDLNTGENLLYLPQLSFSKNSSAIIPPAEGTRSEDVEWYNRFMYSYRMSAENRKLVNILNFTHYETVDDSVILVSNKIKKPRTQAGVKHTVSLSASGMSISYFGVTPRITYVEDWIDELREYQPNESGGVDTVKHDQFAARRTFSGIVSFNTKLYGLFHPKVLGLDAIRHTLSPSIDFTYRPDFSDKAWGYYDIIPDSTGRERFYDRYSGGIYGATTRGKQMSLGLGVSNLFEYKSVKEDREVKGEMFTLGLNTSHNFTADSLKWSNLISSMRISPLGGAAGQSIGGVKLSGLTFDLSGTHSFYKQSPISGTSSYVTVDQGADEFLRLVRFEITTTFRLEGKSESDQQQSAGGSAIPGFSGDRFEQATWTPSTQPWQAGLSFRYTEQFENPLLKNKDIWGSLNLEVQATKNWKVSYTTRFNLESKTIVSNNISIYRDLHCWEGMLIWNPTGVGKGLYLKINVKSPQLQDVKIEKREGSGGYVGF